MFGEFETASVFQALAGLGIGIFAGTYALFALRRIGGDSLAYFAGNSVAAALLLASNLGGFDLGRMLLQIALIALAFGAMILAFLSETGPARDG